MNNRTPINSMPHEWLAAYADGQLDAATRQQVECWLAEHPEALGELEIQEGLSPANLDYWDSVAPAMPSGAQWNRALSHIADAVMPKIARPSTYRSSRVVLAIAGAAAAMFIAVLAIDRQRAGSHRNQSAFPDETAARPAIYEIDDEDLVFRVATADDVELIQLPESAAPYVVVGRHPMADVPLLLASASDLQLLNYGPDDQGNLPDIETTLGPDASMLWAPSTKP